MATPVVWLPLNGNLKNQGTFGNNVLITNNGATVNTSGKVGSCYYFNGSAYMTGPMDYSSFTTAWSITLWFKVDSAPSSWATICNIGKANGFANEFTNIVLNGSNLYVVVANGSTSNTSTFGIAYTAGSWHHVAFTYKNRNLTLWLDGVQKKTQTVSFDPAPAGSTHFALGASYNNAERLTGYLNDIRIYNEALSPKEVKEISQGLIIHYPLNHINDNLIPNNKITFGTTKEWTGQGWASTCINHNNLVSIIQPSTQYTFSWDAEVIERTTVPTNYDIHIGFLFYSPSTSSANVSSYQGSMQTVGKKCHVKTTFTTPATIPNDYILIFYTNRYTTNGSNPIGLDTIKYSNIKLEKGSNETAYCLSSLDSGKNLSEIIDTSGFNNNGIINGSLTAVTGSSRYQTATYFNGTDTAIRTPNLATLITDGIFSISLWFKRNTGEWGSKTWETLYGGPGGFELEAKLSSNNTAYIHPYSWGGGSTGSPNSYSFAYSLDTWHHLVMVRTPSDSKFYLDGELKVTGTAGSIPSNNYFIGAWNTAAQQNFRGSISNFRLYSTILSTADIIELYNTAYSIDSLGQGHGYEYQEGSNLISIQKNGIIKQDELNEIITLSDGSMWLPIMVHDNKSGTNLFSSSDDFTKLVYHNDDCWAEFPLINSAPRPDSSKYEFLVYQRPTNDANFQSMRWSQTSNPTSATSVSGFTAITTGVTNTAVDGLCRCNGNTYMARTGTTSNWWHACGCWAKYQTGIPGWNTTTVNRELLLFMRVSSNNYRDIKNSFVIGTNFLEI